MGRKPKVRRQACSVEVTASGLLRFRFRSKTPDGALRKFAEATALPDTPENRERVRRQAELIGAEIRAGQFDYLKWFPYGNRAADFLTASGQPPEGSTAKPEALTVRGYYDEWIERKVAPYVRKSAARDYKGHFRGHILDHLGDTALEDLSLAHLEDLRGALRKRGLSEKTIRNIIDGSFRAMVRDAMQDDIPAAFPFPKVRWPEKIVPGPSPFEAEERDRILAHFRGKQWKVSGFNNMKPHYPYFAFLYTLFFTGMRPSEAAAIRIRSVNLGAGTIQVERSRHLGQEAATKTRRARRAVRLTRKNIEVLKPLIELKAMPDDYLFKNVRGEPIEQANFYDLFRDAQRALEITPLRDLYSTKDTYLSLALTNGVSLTWLSEQTGVAVGTILTHYGRFVHSSQADDFELSKIEGFGGQNDPKMV
ncbi:MAG TPA: tyrosine-type recombinase/integrase, partial [Candidatus Binataceae bacterium]|nr:tyrosine-type recombinase/integrase [Candidatus Binataceae bacterium]